MVAKREVKGMNRFMDKVKQFFAGKKMLAIFIGAVIVFVVAGLLLD
jgi:F0F1-type ATP synthase assembly protein I